MAIKYLTIFLAWILSWPLLAISLPNDFEARYEVEKYGTVIAAMQLSLQHQKQLITYHSNTRARGLLALISNDKIDENSHLQQINNITTLINYDYTRKKKPHDNQHYRLKINSDGHTLINGEYDKKAIQLNSPLPVWDKQSVQLALMSDISRNTPFNTTYTYNIVDDGKFKQYQFEYLSNETVRIGKKRYKTLKVKRQHDKQNKRVSYFWLAPELNNLPVKIEQYKKGKLNLNMQLKDFKWTKHD